jgi:hypothetical protein
MYNRRGAFLYKIETDESNATLLKKLETFAKAKKIDLNGERPWRGFMVQGENNDLMASTHKNTFHASYGYEFVKKEPIFNGKTETTYDPYIVSIIADAEKKVGS